MSPSDIIEADYLMLKKFFDGADYHEIEVASFGDAAKARAVRKAEGQSFRANFLLLLFFVRQRKVN